MPNNGFMMRPSRGNRKAESSVEEGAVGDRASDKDKDEIELAHFGKKQRMKRNFGIVSIVGLVCTLMITWEAILVVLPQSLNNGGPLGAICEFIFAWVGVGSQTLVMAELASMMPLAGGEYNWVSVLAPPQYARFMSYITGWITVVAWQGAMASAVFLAGQIVQALAVLNYPTYTPTLWQFTLILLAILAVSLLVNTLLARLLPSIESGILLLHVLGFFGVLVPLVYLGPKSDPHDVWNNFINGGGWDTKGLSFFVGTAVSMLTFAGVDGATHMAEEIENASTVIPQAMIAAVVINGSTGFGLLVAVLFCAGDLTQAINSPTGQPFLEIFYNAVGSVGGATGMAVIMLLAIIFCAMGFIATTSRMLWAFARERGVPFHGYLTKLTHNHPLPLIAILVTTVLNALLALINLGSTAAFNAFTSLTVSAYYISYSLAAGCLLWRKLKKLPLRYGPFRLGRLDVPIIIFSLAYSVIGAFFSFWPQTPNPTPKSMNWAIVVFSAAIFASLGYWFSFARKTYTGPITEVRLDTNDRIHDVE